MIPIPPQSLEAALQLLADSQSTYINQTIQAKEVRRLLGPDMCYLDEGFNMKEIHDVPNSSASLSPTVTTTSGGTSTSTTTTLAPDVSPSASVSASPSPEAIV